jgi:SAM-dependent methyltransferase
MAEYILASGVEAQQRLRLLARICHQPTLALLERAGLKEGYRCLDVGCGSGDVTMDIARRVGPTGRAIGIDFDEDILRLAREEALGHRVQNVEFRHQRAETLDETGYDLVYARFLLTHLGEPHQTLRAMVNAVRPGGVVVVEDVEFSATFCFPPHAAFERFVRWVCETMRRRGADPDIGPRLPGLFGTAGLAEVAMHLAQVPLYRMEEKKPFFDITMLQIRNAALAEGVVTSEEFDTTYAAFQALTADPDSVCAMPRTWQVWGYKR